MIDEEIIQRGIRVAHERAKLARSASDYLRPYGIEAAQFDLHGQLDLQHTERLIAMYQTLEDESARHSPAGMIAAVWVGVGMQIALEKQLQRMDNDEGGGS